MTNIIFSRKEFEKQIKITSEVQDKITAFGTPLESVNQESIEIEVFANRPDLISINGFMRSFKSFLGKETGLKSYKINKPEKDYRINIDKSVKEVRPYTACAIVKGLNLTDWQIKDIINMQEKLALTLGRNRKKMGIGIYPLDKIKLPLIYTAKNKSEIKYQPLGFDRELSAKEILLLHPTGKKYEHLLANHSKYPLFVDANKEILSMPPIVNSEKTGRINSGTKEVFIECTGTDKRVLEKTLIIVSSALAEIGGKIYQMEIIDSEKSITPDFTPQKMKISLNSVNKLLGLSLNENQISQMLNRMGHNYRSGNVEIPPWRTDILHEVDLIEDIAIAYGYNNFITEIPNISTSGEESKESIFKRKISETLVGLGMLEISSYHLIKEEEKELCTQKEIIELEDSKTEYKVLRPNLFIPMLRTLAENKDAEYPQKIFEIGRVFAINNQKETGISEKDNLIIGLSPSNFTECKQYIDYLFNSLQITYSIKELSQTNFIDGRTGAIILNNKTIGYIGEVHPNCLKKVGIKMPLSIAEISLEEIYKLIN